MLSKWAGRTLGGASTLGLLLATLMPNGCLESAENVGIVEEGQAQRVREAVGSMVKRILDTGSESKPRPEPEIRPKQEHHRPIRPLRKNAREKLSINFEPMVDTTVPDFSFDGLKVKI